MRRLFGTALAFCLLAGGAQAQSTPVSIFSGKLRPSLGYCQLNVDAATRLSACSGGIPAGAMIADISIETQAIRYRTDGTNPTTSVGMPIAAGAGKIFTLTDLSQIRMIAQVAGAVVNIEFYAQ